MSFPMKLCLKICVFLVVSIVASDETGCEKSKSIVNSGWMQPCKGQLIFEDDFRNTSVNEDKWFIEEYIPKKSEDMEFVSYRNDNQTISIEESTLKLMPIALKTQLDWNLTLHNCTKNSKNEKLEMVNECSHKQKSSPLPPVKSARIRSKLTFKYGRVEIRAKLPSGDWIYPIINLLPTNERNPSKIVIAFSRGNDHLFVSEDEDIGSRVLYGGYVPTNQGPQRNSQLKSYRLTQPLSNDFHTFELLWEPNKVTLSVDDIVFGTNTPTPLQERILGMDEGFAWEEECYLALGVAVGGATEFPDNSLSGNQVKPWENFHVDMVSSFSEASPQWHKTWIGNETALKVDYVKIWSL